MLRIRQLRERKGVSLRELARRSGVGVATLSRIESGKAIPRLNTLLQHHISDQHEFFIVVGADLLLDRHSGIDEWLLRFRHSRQQVFTDA